MSDNDGVFGIPRGELCALGGWYWPIRIRRCDEGYLIEVIEEWEEPAGEPRVIPEVVAGEGALRYIVGFVIDKIGEGDEEQREVSRALWEYKEFKDAIKLSVEAACTNCKYRAGCNDRIFSSDTNEDLQLWCPWAPVRAVLED